MTHQLGLRQNTASGETATYLARIAGDYAPTGVFEVISLNSVDQRDQDFWRGELPCHHAHSSFWFWMWAFNSGNRHVVHHHHYAPMAHNANHNYYDAGQFSGGRSVRNSEGMSGGERTFAASLGALIAAVAVASYSLFSKNESNAQEGLGAAQKIIRQWKYVTPLDEEKIVYDCLMHVLKAQEKVESRRTMNASIYKWSCVIIGIAGVALVIGSVANSLPVVIAGLVVVVAAGVFAGVTALIAVYSDDAAEAKAVAHDYRIVSRHFLLPPEGEAYRESSAPPAYRDLDETIRNDQKRDLYY